MPDDKVPDDKVPDDVDGLYQEGTDRAHKDRLNFTIGAILGDSETDAQQAREAAKKWGELVEERDRNHQQGE